MNVPTDDMRRGRGDDGALLAELALITPFLVTLMLGIFEFGFAYRERANIAAAVRTTQRTDTANGATRSADYNAFLAFSSAMSQAKNFQVTRLVIYNTDSSGAPPAPGCLTGTPSPGCNVYSAATIAGILAAGAIPRRRWEVPRIRRVRRHDIDVNYCPAARTDSPDAPAGPDWVGVYVEGIYTSYTGLLPGQVTFTDSSLGRLDPRPGP